MAELERGSMEILGFGIGDKVDIFAVLEKTSGLIDKAIVPENIAEEMEKILKDSCQDYYNSYIMNPSTLSTPNVQQVEAIAKIETVGRLVRAFGDGEGTNKILAVVGLVMAKAYTVSGSK